VAPAAVSTMSLAGPGLGDSDVVAFAELASWLLLVGIQVHRYRHADWTARQQTKLVLLAVVLVVANLVLGTLADLAGLVGAYQPVAVLLTYVALGALNVGMLVARERARQDPRCRPGGRGAARPAGGTRLVRHVELWSRTTPTVTSSNPPRSKSRLSWSALIVAVSPSNGP